MADINSGEPLVGVYTGSSAAVTAQFESWLGQPVDAVLSYTDDSTWESMSPSWVIDQIDRTQLISIPLFPQTSSLAEVANGAGNQHYATYAQELLAEADRIDAPDGSIYVRTAWEMGGEWFPWGQQGNDHPDLFIAAFRNFADTFHDASDDFQIVWDVAGDRGNVERFYPGDEYVDVVSQDFYWNPQWTSYDGAEAFAIIRDRPYGLQWLEDFADAHGKQTAYSEWGVSPGAEGGDFVRAAAEWFNDPEHNVAYHTVWNSNAGSYSGVLTDSGHTESGAAYRDAFGLA